MTTDEILALRQLNGKPFLLDGAIGSYLEEVSDYEHSPLWSSKKNIEDPENVFNLYEAYLKAGADILSTNTFRTNPIAFELSDSNRNYKNFVKDSVNITLEAAKKYDILVAGSNAPAEDCYNKERKLSKEKLEYNHKNHIDLLVESGVSFILNETFGHLDEIKIVSDYCEKNNIPFVLSLFMNDDNKILSGHKLEEVYAFLSDKGPLAVTINCATIETYILLRNRGFFFDGFYLNCGSGNYSDKLIKTGISPSVYKDLAKHFSDRNQFMLGACCGSGPNHIAELRTMLDELY